MPTGTPLKWSCGRSVHVPDSVLSLICDSVIWNSHGPTSWGSQCLLCVLQELSLWSVGRQGYLLWGRRASVLWQDTFLICFLYLFCSAAVQVLQGSCAVSSLCVYKRASQRVCCYCELTWKKKCKNKKVGFADVLSVATNYSTEKIEECIWGLDKTYCSCWRSHSGCILRRHPFSGF